MRIPRGVSAASAFIIMLLASTRAHAQATPPPFDPAIDIQAFRYAAGPKTFFTVNDADTADKGQLAVDALLTFATNPFTIYNVSPTDPNTITGTRDRVVKSLWEMQITAGYGITDKLAVGVNLPIVFDLAGNGLDAATGGAAMGGLQVTGLGDLAVEGKYRLYRQKDLGLGVIAGVTVPTSFGSNGSQFIGDNLPTFYGEFLAQYSSGPFSMGANAGIVLRKPRTIYASTIGQEFTWGVGAAYHFTDRFSLVGEGFGHTGLTAFDLDNSPLLLQAGIRVVATSSMVVTAGGGGGVIKGIGSPDAEFFLSVGYAPDIRDSDGDGIPNARDKCPFIAEDKDGFQDQDGCPDDDNDGDRIPDSEDKCPNQAEDIDGFEDEDGCPDLDNDKDGIPDLEDKCPNDPEDGLPPYPHDGCPANKRDSDGDGIPDDKDQCPLEEEDMDGFEDGDGCPDLDNDGDGIPDAQDKCPLCPADKDGFQDQDGCPDLDNDNDGILDAQDKCANEPETVNGYQDQDGCPDTGGQVVVHFEGDTVTVDKPPTVGTTLIDQIGLVMAGHQEVSKWLVAIAMPSAGDAQRLGDAVKARILSKHSNMTADMIDVLAAAGPAKIGVLVQARRDADTPFVCPESMLVKERPDRAAEEAGRVDPGALITGNRQQATGIAGCLLPVACRLLPVNPDAPLVPSRRLC